MAKVLISIPDDLLRRLDEHAARSGETRSGFLQRIAAKEADVADAKLREELEGMLDEITFSAPGLDAAQLIREGRDNR